MKFKIYVVLFSLLTLSACGGGGGNDLPISPDDNTDDSLNENTNDLNPGDNNTSGDFNFTSLGQIVTLSGGRQARMLLVSQSTLGIDEIELTEDGYLAVAVAVAAADVLGAPTRNDDTQALDIYAGDLNSVHRVSSTHTRVVFFKGRNFEFANDGTLALMTELESGNSAVVRYSPFDKSIVELVQSGASLEGLPGLRSLQKITSMSYSVAGLAFTGSAVDLARDPELPEQELLSALWLTTQAGTTPIAPALHFPIDVPITNDFFFTKGPSFLGTSAVGGVSIFDELATLGYGDVSGITVDDSGCEYIFIGHELGNKQFDIFETGDVVFSATGFSRTELDCPDKALVRYSAGAYSRLIAEGDSVPNVERATFSQVSSDLSHKMDDGRFVFTAVISDENSFSRLPSALLFESNSNDLNLIFLEGESIQDSFEGLRWNLGEIYFGDESFVFEQRYLGTAYSRGSNSRKGQPFDNLRMPVSPSIERISSIEQDSSSNTSLLGYGARNEVFFNGISQTDSTDQATETSVYWELTEENQLSEIIREGDTLNYAEQQFEFALAGPDSRAHSTLNGDVLLTGIFIKQDSNVRVRGLIHIFPKYTEHFNSVPLIC